MNERERLIYIIWVISKLNSNVYNIENPLGKQKICEKSLKSSPSYPKYWFWEIICLKLKTKKSCEHWFEVGIESCALRMCCNFSQKISLCK
jgi:hypothetical protein